jgi:hypothetical protein
VKGVRHENKINRSGREATKLIGITRYEIAIGQIAFRQTMARHFQ